MRTQNSEPRTQKLLAALCICGIILLAGCEKNAQKAKVQTGKQKPALAPAKAKPAEANEVKLSPEKQIARLKAENEELKKQLEDLMGIDKPARLKALSTINSIELTERSNLYDKNKDKKKETLIVYLRPIDDMGDVIKTAGSVNVQLWNLGAKPQDSLLAEWKIEPQELKKKWSGSLLTSYYKLAFDVNSIVTGKEKDLTIKAEFTDYLTGKALRAQRVLNGR